MEPLRTTTARLRRTFAYPTDDSSTTSSSAGPEALDEEEQERLITTLAVQNETRNAQFRHLLFALPALSAVPYLISLVTLSHPQAALLALTSLASTAWLLYYLPAAETGITYLDGLGKHDGGGRPGAGGIFGDGEENEEEEDDDVTRALRRQRQRRRRASSFSVSRREIFHRTPLETWLPYLNLGLCGLLVAIGMLKSARNGGQSLVMDLLPSVVYAVVLAAKMVMGGVDPEGELGALRYEYKGA